MNVNKKIIRILLVLLMILSINITCYGYSETTFDVDASINLNSGIKSFFKEISDETISAYEGIYIGEDYFEINNYMILAVILIYIIINLLIIRKRRDFIKVSIKINVIILWSILLLIVSKCIIVVASRFNIFFIDEDFLNSIILLGTVMLLVVSLLLQKLLASKDKAIIDKYNYKVKIVLTILLVINFIVSIINYNYVIIRVEKNIDNKKEVLVEEVVLRDHLPDEVKKYTVSIGDNIQQIGKDSEVLTISEDRIIVKDIIPAGIPHSLFHNLSLEEIGEMGDLYKSEREIGREFKWNTWYSKQYEGEHWDSIFIRFTKK